MNAVSGDEDYLSFLFLHLIPDLLQIPLLLIDGNLQFPDLFCVLAILCFDETLELDRIRYNASLPGFSE
jgi:hypothetical protein